MGALKIISVLLGDMVIRVLDWHANRSEKKAIARSEVETSRRMAEAYRIARIHTMRERVDRRLREWKRSKDSSVSAKHTKEPEDRNR